jgi:four helix bundle protein
VAFMFEKLEVYQKAVDFADEIAALTESFPRGYGYLVDQLNRAALSIAANLAEGNGRFTKPDRRNFFTIARGSAQECVPLLEIARRRGLVQETAALELRERLEVIAKMISGLINGMDKRDVPAPRPDVPATLASVPLNDYQH